MAIPVIQRLSLLSSVFLTRRKILDIERWRSILSRSVETRTDKTVVIITTWKQNSGERASTNAPPIGQKKEVSGEMTCPFFCFTKPQVAEIKIRYQQAHKPIIEQETIEGHSVRAMYLLTAVADLVRIDNTGNTGALRNALARLWTNMVDKKMYLTGGIGAMKQWEGFGIDYFLPSGTDEGGCYAETCAGIGVMMLAERMLQVGKLANILPRKY
jgi:hypothetical protein